MGQILCLSALCSCVRGFRSTNALPQVPESTLDMKCGVTKGQRCKGEPPNGWGDFGTDLYNRACRRKCKLETTCKYVTVDSSGQCTSWQECMMVADSSSGWVWKNCEGIDDDHGNSIGDATKIQVSIVTHGGIQYPRDKDYFCVVLERPGMYLFASSGDTRNTIYDKDGHLFEETFVGELALAIQKSGEYCMKIQRGWSFKSVTYNASVTPITDDDHGDSIEAATMIQAGNVIPGEIEWAGDVDYLCAELMNGVYLFKAEVPPYEDSSSQRATLTVYDSDANRLAWSRRLEAEAVLQIERAGKYCMKVAPYVSRVSRDNPTYNASVVLVSDLPDDHGNSVENATTIEIDTPTRGEIQYLGDVDFFCVELMSGVYTFVTELADTRVSVYDSDGNELGSARVDDYDDYYFYTWPDVYCNYNECYGVEGLEIETAGRYCMSVASPSDRKLIIYDALVKPHIPPVDDHSNSTELG